MRLLRHVLLATAVVGAPGIARADDRPKQPDGLVDGFFQKGDPERKPFDPDTETRITGEELLERGVQNLAEALEELPEMVVVEGGRGDTRVNVRAARQRAVMVIVDGVPVDEPYYGGFDLASIPAADIAEVRVSLSPASPLDGPGGPGGVIEVRTLAASGPRRLSARAQASSAPDAYGAVTGRARIYRDVHARVSAGGTYGWRELDAAMPEGGVVELEQHKRAAQASLLLESQSRVGIIRLHAFAQQRSFVVPPGEEDASSVLVIDGEQSARLALSGETHVRGWRLQGTGYLQLLGRDATLFEDASMRMVVGGEHLDADRSGLDLRVDRRLGDHGELAFATRVHSEAATVTVGEGMPAEGRATVGQVAGGLNLGVGDVRLEMSAGLAVPFLGEAAPWPEAKLAATWSPVTVVELRGTFARKGRLPTLRERFAPSNGNPDLAPEMSLFGEVGVTLRPTSRVELTFGGWVRDTEDLIRLDEMRTAQTNIGQVLARGLEARLELNRRGLLGGGVAYAFTDATAPADDFTGPPLDLLPAHTAETFVTGLVGRRAGWLGRLRYIGERVDRNELLDPYVTADASIWARVAGDVRASIRAENLAGARYQERAGIFAPGRTFVLSVDGTWE
jgi:outer membrane receptor protein involved in Fe transport